MSLKIEEHGSRRLITDSENPRIYSVEWRCALCGEWVSEEETVWINPDTKEATTCGKGYPYHVDCAPNQY